MDCTNFSKTGASSSTATALNAPCGPSAFQEKTVFRGQRRRWIKLGLPGVTDRDLQAQWRQSAGLLHGLADTPRQRLAAKAYRRTDAVELGAPTAPLNRWHLPKGGRAPLTIRRC